MSYDLTLTSDASLSSESIQMLRRRIEQVADLNGCEILANWDVVYVPAVEAQQGVVTVCLPNSEVAAVRAFSELKAIALACGLRLYDPQAGEDVDLIRPSSLPEMF